MPSGKQGFHDRSESPKGKSPSEIPESDLETFRQKLSSNLRFFFGIWDSDFPAPFRSLSSETCFETGKLSPVDSSSQSGNLPVPV